VRIERAGRADAPIALEHLLRLHTLRWEKRDEAGVLASDEIQAFQREAVPALAEHGLLRLYSLFIDERAASVYYALAHNGRAYLYLTGFDPLYDHESPGVVLMAHVMSEAVAEGCFEIDFLRGSEPYKYEWGAVDRWNLKRSIRASRD
jgi:CelD/BcsL family acetyltransferase involved in cellulose biosynthesis